MAGTLKIVLLRRQLLECQQLQPHPHLLQLQSLQVQLRLQWFLLLQWFVLENRLQLVEKENDAQTCAAGLDLHAQ